MQDILDAIVTAHGGREYWRTLKGIEVTMSAGGALFRFKKLPPLHHVRLTLDTNRPELILHDYPAPGQVGRFHGEERVEIQDAAGNVLQSRSHPRKLFRRVRRLLSWDSLDFVYFCGYAMWNYLTMPFLLEYPGVAVTTSGSDAQGLTRLTVTFPDGFPTHCGTQEFYFDREWHLRRHDYTAEIVGPWARAAHLCDAYKQVAGLALATRRRIHPKLFNKPLPIATLVWIDIHEVKPLPA